MNIVWALANVVVLEMIRRKDFYVLFILTVLILSMLLCCVALWQAGTPR